ncbi:uncharacterized protein LOC124286173 [Haliotis rubra]|uniref:uncharacterized protein LOC124286173 n=1 Tax=Haliotis rubra TaxID=36100 RepID=UPI001EE529A9|nr:uncharacterized protein LOC124286173 [Haliotis rubra]
MELTRQYESSDQEDDDDFPCSFTTAVGQKGVPIPQPPLDLPMVCLQCLVVCVEYSAVIQSVTDQNTDQFTLYRQLHFLVDDRVLHAVIVFAKWMSDMLFACLLVCCGAVLCQGKETSRIQIINERDNWWEAQRRCKDNGGKLYTPGSDDIPEKLVENLQSDTYYWIGAMSYRAWLWTVDSSPLFTYAGFLPLGSVTVEPKGTYLDNSVWKCHLHCSPAYSVGMKDGVQRPRSEQLVVEGDKQERNWWTATMKKETGGLAAVGWEEALKYFGWDYTPDKIQKLPPPMRSDKQYEMMQKPGSGPR